MKDAQERWLQPLRDKVQTVTFSLQESCIKVSYTFPYTFVPFPYTYVQLYKIQVHKAEAYPPALIMESDGEDITV